MAFWFGDGFDLYTSLTDCGTYWDAAFGGGVTLALSASGRFAGSRGITNINVLTAPYITKTSGANDAVHHISVAVQQTSTLTGTSNNLFISLIDGATTQCTIAFRSNGDIQLQSGAVGGTTLATYTGAIAAINTWYQFEFEIVINNTTGSIAVRRNGNTSNDFSLGSLNTRASANNYANKIGLGGASGAAPQIADDFLWRSDASSVAWVGDVRCYTRMPAADSSVAWSRSGSVVPETPFVSNGTFNWNSGNGVYSPLTAVCTGTIGSVSLNFTVAATANFKCSIYASAAGAPTTVLGSATVVTNPGTGTVTFTFGTPVSVTLGTQYWVAWHSDASSGTASAYSTGSPGLSGAVSYASFPATNPTGLSATSAAVFIANITPTAAVNAPFVAEPQQDGAASYVYSSTVSQSDLYTIQPIGSTPAGVLAVTTRGYVQKSDAGTRLAAVQIQSGATNAQATPLALPAGSWAWNWRTDQTDPATGAAWTATSVNNALIGAIVTT